LQQSSYVCGVFPQVGGLFKAPYFINSFKKKTLELSIYKGKALAENTFTKSNSSFLIHWFFCVPLTKDVSTLQPEV